VANKPFSRKGLNQKELHFTVAPYRFQMEKAWLGILVFGFPKDSRQGDLPMRGKPVTPVRKNLFGQ